MAQKFKLHYKDYEKDAIIIVFGCLLICLVISTVLLANNKSSDTRSKANTEIVSTIPSTLLINGGGTINKNEETTVTISIDENKPFNAIDLDVVLSNFTFVKAEALNGLTIAVPPTVSGPKVNLVLASLGKPVASNSQIVKIVLRSSDSQSTAKVSSNATIALVDGSGSKQELIGSNAYYVLK